MENLNNLGTDALENELVGVLNTAKTLGTALGDGFQLTDIGALISVAGDVKAIVNNGKQALKELLDLSPTESEEVAARVAARAGLPNFGILGKVNEGLQLLARTHREVADDIDLFEDWKLFVTTLKD